MSVTTYIQWPDIRGNITATGFEDHMEVDTVTFSAKNIAHDSGGSNAGATVMGDFIITKTMAGSSVSLLNALVRRMVATEIKIKFLRLGGGGEAATIPFMVYTLSNVGIVDYLMTSARDQADPVESLTLSYTKLEQKFTEVDRDGRARGQEVMTYDLRRGSVR
jgi:type VI secretion system secreted protein Hcp